MEKYKASASTRFFLLVAGVIVWTGIWLTGFGTAHWLLYVPATMFVFAAATGICPGLLISKILFKDGKPN